MKCCIGEVAQSPLAELFGKGGEEAGERSRRPPLDAGPTPACLDMRHPEFANPVIIPNEPQGFKKFSKTSKVLDGA